MRTKKRVKELEIQLAYLTEYVKIISDSVLELLEKEDERAEKAKNLDSGKWYRNS